MKHISVIAHGSEGSFVRRVQHDPTIAVELLQALTRLCEAFYYETFYYETANDQHPAVLAAEKAIGRAKQVPTE